MNPAEIANACDIPLFCLPYGNYYFYSQAEIDSFQVNYPGCTELHGDVMIVWDITNLNGLNNLISIGNNLTIDHTALSNFSGLEQLNLIGGFFDIWANDSLSSLTGLGSLTSIGGFRIAHNDAITDLTGLGYIDSIDGGLTIEDNKTMASLTGLENLTYLGGNLSINDNDTLINLTGLNNLTSIGGYLYINNNKILSDLTELEGLISTGSGFYIGANDSLTNLTGLENVISVGGELYIISNNSLTDISGIKNIDESTISELNINSNSSLSSCDIQSICDYLASPNGYTYIYNNNTGCNSRQEIVTACEVGLNDSSSPKSHFIIYPNPSSATITIKTTELLNLGELTILNVNGQALDQYQIKEPRTVIDISHLAEGVYFVRFTSENEVGMFKVVKY
jgi:hypothetical protein